MGTGVFVGTGGGFVGTGGGFVGRGVENFGSKGSKGGIGSSGA